jgi:hypothetical protein
MTGTGKAWNELCTNATKDLADIFLKLVLERKTPLKIVVHWMLTQAFTIGFLQGTRHGAVHPPAKDELVHDLAELGVEVFECEHGFSLRITEETAAETRKAMGLQPE